MDNDPRSLFLYILQAFAKASNWSDEWVMQSVSLTADLAGIRLVSEEAHEVVLKGEAIWDVYRQFDYGDGEGDCKSRRKLLAKLRVAASAEDFPPGKVDGCRAGEEEFIGLYGAGKVEWRQENGRSAPHWLARQPMPVPDGFHELLEARPSLWLWTDVR